MYSFAGKKSLTPFLWSLRQTFCHRWHLLTIHFTCAATAKPGFFSPASEARCTKALMLYMQPTGMLMAATNLESRRSASNGLGTKLVASLWCSQWDVLAPCTHQNCSHHHIPSTDPPPKHAALCHKPQPQSLGDKCGNSALKNIHESCTVWSGKKKRALLITLGILRFMTHGAIVLGLCWLSADFYSACHFTPYSKGN